MRLHRLYLALALGLFLVELCIALFAHDRFVRPYVGDVLVVPLVHFGIATLLVLRPHQLGLGVFLFACLVEVAQYFRTADLLGMNGNVVARTVLGTTFSVEDLVAYAIGALLSVWVHERLERRQGRATTARGS